MVVLDTPANRSDVINDFALLANDNNFKITSPSDPDYNCIAWAANIGSEWWWPIPNAPKFFDGIIYNWPFNLPVNKSLETFKKLFELKDYVECTSHIYDSAYIKIAIYINPQTNECTHAARQLRPNGFWTSKLGRDFDIQHSTPYTIEGPAYGKVACIMQKVF